MKIYLIVALCALIAIMGVFATGCDASSPPRVQARSAAFKAQPMIRSLDARSTSMVQRFVMQAVFRDPVLLASRASVRRDIDRFRAPETPATTSYSYGTLWRPPNPSPENLQAALTTVVTNRAREKV